MSVQNNFTYGVKTTTEIEALTGMVVGDTVFNSDFNKVEYYTGDIWTNDDCYVLTNNTGSAIPKGYIVSPSTTTAGGVIITTSSAWARAIGVVVRGGATGAGEKIVVANTGVHYVYMVSTVTSVTTAHVATIASTDGQVNTTGAKTGSAKALGIFTESHASIPGDRLIKVWLQIIERY